jgi:hypothetical protein
MAWARQGKERRRDARRAKAGQGTSQGKARHEEARQCRARRKASQGKVGADELGLDDPTDGRVGGRVMT